MYKNSLPTLDGYLTHQGKINFSNCDVLFRDIAKYEEEFFRLEQAKHEREARFGDSRGRGRGGRGGGDQNRQASRGPDGAQAPAKSEETLLEEAKVELKQELDKLNS